LINIGACGNIKDQPMDQTMHRTKLLYSTRSLQIRYIPVLKCGSTRVLNLMYLLDNGHAHPDPNNIHSTHGLAIASDFDLTHTDIAGEQHAFVVMRDPTRRFLSLYFDKIVGGGGGGFKRLLKQLERTPDFDRDAETIAGHFKNCIVLADVLERALNDREYLPLNGHWAMQTLRLGAIKDCDLKVLLLENMDRQMSVLLGDIVPDIAAKLDSLGGRNRSPKPIEPSELMLPALIERIGEIYPRDQMYYDRAVEKWAQVDMASAKATDVTRLI
jgi:hypothetical protein